MVNSRKNVLLRQTLYVYGYKILSGSFTVNQDEVRNSVIESWLLMKTNLFLYVLFNMGYGDSSTCTHST